jgi:hypothetical protein
MTSSSSSDIWHQLIDHDKNAVGNMFFVTITSTDTVSNLKRKIREEHPDDLARISAKRLTAWRCPNLCIDSDEGDDESLDLVERSRRIKLVDFNDERSAQKLDDRRTVAALNLGDEVLLVQLPRKLSSFPSCET